MSRVTRVLSLGYLPSARCAREDCGWNQPAWRETLALAKQHVRETGHHVIVDRLTEDHYRLTEDHYELRD